MYGGVAFLHNAFATQPIKLISQNILKRSFKGSLKMYRKKFKVKLGMRYASETQCLKFSVFYCRRGQGLGEWEF